MARRNRTKREKMNLAILREQINNKSKAFEIETQIMTPEEVKKARVTLVDKMEELSSKFAANAKKKWIKSLIIAITGGVLALGAPFLAFMLFTILPGMATLLLGAVFVPAVITSVVFGIQSRKQHQLYDEANNAKKGFMMGGFRPQEQYANAKTITAEASKEASTGLEKGQEKENSNKYVFKMLSREGDEKGKNITEQSGKIISISTSSVDKYIQALKALDFSYTEVDGKRVYNNKDIEALVSYRNNQVYSNEKPMAVDMRFVATKLWDGESSLYTSKDYDSIYAYLDDCEKMVQTLIASSSKETRTEKIQELKREIEDYKNYKKQWQEKKEALEKDLNNIENVEDEDINSSENNYDNLYGEIFKIEHKMEVCDNKIKELSKQIEEFQNLPKGELKTGTKSNERSGSMHGVKTIKAKDAEYIQTQMEKEDLEETSKLLW